MTLLIIIWSFVFLVYMAIYNGMYVRYKTELLEKAYDAATKWGKAWHGWGWIMRAGVIALLAPITWGDWWLVGLLSTWGLVVTWPVYDGLINLFNGGGFWISGTTAFWDKFTGKFNKALKILTIILAICFTILYLIIKQNLI